MAILPGARLGVYEVTGSIGAGGMGEVYRATDTALKRSVALKVLPEGVAADAERLARFQREAEVLAALNHPKIAGIYGLEASTGVKALVMEFVEGPTLADRLAQGAIPVDEAVAIAIQIAEALEAAHEQGIVHRDLKPANIKVRPDGAVKVLDFGLAKAVGRDGSDTLASGTNAPTITSPAQTALGMILGTAAYMAPEQALGKKVDKRADIWAFGVVLWEMLTGRALFQSDSVPATLAAVIRADIDLRALPAATPAVVRALVARCLDRSTATRLRDIGEARIALVSPTAAPAEAVAVPEHRTQWGRLAAAVLGTAAIVGVAGWLMMPVSPAAPLRKFVVDGMTASGAFAIAPDGSRVAYLVGDTLWVRDFDDLAPRALAEVATATATGSPMVWSPDSQHLGYVADEQLWRMPAAGGQPVSLAKLPESGRMLNAVWGADNTIVVSVWRGGLYDVPASGSGEPAPRLPLREGIVDYHGLGLLPDGSLILSPHYFDDREGETWIVSPDGETVLPRMGGAVYSRGHLLYVRADANRGLWAAPFDLATRRLPGDPFPVAPGANRYSVSDTGLLLYGLPRDGETSDELVWLGGAAPGTSARDATPAQAGNFGPGIRIADVAPSPDGRRLALALVEKEQHRLVVRDTATGLDRSIVPASDVSIQTVTWSPDARFILFSHSQGFLRVISAVSSDGTGEPRTIAEGTNQTFSADGATLFFVADERGERRIRTVGFRDGVASGEPAFLRRPADFVFSPAPSPDGRFIAYAERKDGVSNVYVSRHPGDGRQWPVSSAPAVPLRWIGPSELVIEEAGEGGRRLDRLKVVSLTVVGDDITPRAPRPLFDALPTPAASGQFRLIARAGTRWLIVRSLADGADAEGRVVLVENWLAEFTSRPR